MKRFRWLKTAARFLQRQFLQVFGDSRKRDQDGNAR
jgi:hypothetical protein